MAYLELDGEPGYDARFFTLRMEHFTNSPECGNHSSRVRGVTTPTSSSWSKRGRTGLGGTRASMVATRAAVGRQERADVTTATARAAGADAGVGSSTTPRSSRLPMARAPLALWCWLCRWRPLPSPVLDQAPSRCRSINTTAVSRRGIRFLLPGGSPGSHTTTASSRMGFLVATRDALLLRWSMSSGGSELPLDRPPPRGGHRYPSQRRSRRSHPQWSPRGGRHRARPDDARAVAQAAERRRRLHRQVRPR